MYFHGTRRWLLAAIFLSMLPASANEVPIRVYIFGAEHCPTCQKALNLLRKINTTDKSFSLRDYNIERSTEEAELYIRVILATGLPEPVVPIVIVGPHVMLGFDDDETSGQSILRRIDYCKKARCPDFVADLENPVPPVAYGGPPRRSWHVHRHSNAVEIR